MKKDRPSSKKPKAIPPTKAASGEGFTIEDKIGAICAAALLLSRSPFSRLPGHLTRIDFQVAADHWQFNDLLLTMEDTAGAYRAAVSIRSKREITSKGFSVDTKNSLVVQFTKEPSSFSQIQQLTNTIMAKYKECDSCGNVEKGTTIYQCKNCGRVCCGECANPETSQDVWKLGTCFCGGKKKDYGGKLFVVLGHIR